MCQCTKLHTLIYPRVFWNICRMLGWVLEDVLKRTLDGKCLIFWPISPLGKKDYELGWCSCMELVGCVEVIVPLENISLIWRRHHCWWRATFFYLCSVLIAIEQWGFFNVPHLLWHGPTLYNGHLRGPVTLTPVAGVWQWSCHTCFYDSGVSWPGIEPRSPACEANALPLRHRGGQSLGEERLWAWLMFMHFKK